MVSNRQNIRQLTKEQLKVELVNAGFKSSAAQRLYQYIWYDEVDVFEQMTELPVSLKAYLENLFYIQKSTINAHQQSSDGTIKCSIRLHDGFLVEAVLIPSPSRVTICVSSQVGCSLSCKFCATGLMDRQRNLAPEEIADQLYLLNPISIRHFSKAISNVVFMGMGEPLLNYKNVLQSLKIITDQKGLSIAPKRITISTAGVAKKIKALADEGVKINLALSLHAANDAKRNQIMPINETNNVDVLKEALQYFYLKSKNSITLEYVLLSGFNDSIADAEELAAFSQQLPVHMVNLIEYNNVPGIPFFRSDDGQIDAFVHHLHQLKVNAYLRRSRGKDIDAACGQLANQG